MLLLRLNHTAKIRNQIQTGARLTIVAPGLNRTRSDIKGMTLGVKDQETN